MYSGQDFRSIIERVKLIFIVNVYWQRVLVAQTAAAMSFTTRFRPEP
jgi:hypothetical protein